MKLFSPSKIKLIDEYAVNILGIPEKTLMARSAEAVYSAFSELSSVKGEVKSVSILAGAGNNGGDGYALALLLADKYEVRIYDVFSSGQRSESGKYYLGKARACGIPILPLSEENFTEALSADALIDAILGTGARPPYSNFLIKLGEEIKKSTALKIAIDVPLGSCAESGEVESFAPTFDATVELCAVKTGIASYPARGKCGRLFVSDIGLPTELLFEKFGIDGVLTDTEFALSALPKRSNEANKGSFGRVSLFVGSEKYFGASALALEGALRGGVGYTTLFGEKEENNLLRLKFPEALYKDRKPFSKMTADDISAIINTPEAKGNIVIGPGCEASAELAELVLALMKLDGGFMLIDADAINSLAMLRKKAISAIKNSKRRLIFTPHPMELSRLIGIEAGKINESRITAVKNFCVAVNECGGRHILLLKGAGTLVCDGESLYVNSVGSSALAKAGSGDVLSGLLGALLSCGDGDFAKLCALGAYLHGISAEHLAEELSDFGVTPSDLPTAIAKEINSLLNPQKVN